MEYLLIVAFAIGLLLFLLSWLRVIIAGFAHHFLTGIVAILPVVNILVLPSVWHQVYAWVMAGFIGFLLAVATWFAGADKQVYQYAHQAGFELPAQQVTHPVAASEVATNQATVEVKIPSTTHTVNTPQTANDDPNQPAQPLPTGKELPKTALFTMAYKAVDTQQLGEYQGQYIRLTQKDRQQYEGKLLDTEAGALRIERRMNGGLVEHKVSFADIVSSEVMTRE
ncbi:hypothetical protein SAMN02745130_02957 [Thiothrix eikelboomii]|uniref:Uncharacterized protein n=1 Tax=Thiothrix eikelboomii TaxID=92487 RepID=A0A1T4XHC3_9GAMM|nr:hypothetical protein SAMN02745130_02957 [Thiothrix eikelboomii]